jgi:hypothetical protein
MSIFSKALQALGLRVQNGDVPAKTQLVEVKLQTEDCINNKLIYNINNKSVIVITCNGDKFEGNNVEKEQLEQLRTANISEIINILTPKQVVKEDLTEREEKEIVSNFLEVFKDSEDFDVVGKELYFKGIKTIPIPTLITARFVELVESLNNLKVPYFVEVEERLKEEYNSLKMFTLKVLLNPVEEARQDALSYINQYAVKLTSNGNMIMFRRIVSVADTNKELVEFISKQYVKVKSWKKSPKNYWVHCNMDVEPIIYSISTQQYSEFNDLGNLAELYQNLPTMEENRYTDNHTGTYDIRIGQTYKINEIDIDTNKRGSCGGALHVTTKDAYDYSSFGDTPVCVIVSPQHIYKMDSGCSGKIGVKQMFIASVTTQNEEGDYEDIDNQALVNFDEYYHNENMLELETSLKQKSLALVSVDNIVSELSIPEVQNITELLKNRIVTI